MGIELKNWDLEKKYKLFNQLQSALAIENIDYESEDFKLLLEKFYDERNIIGEEYIKFLKSLGICFSALYSTELGKSDIDSLAYLDNMKNTQVISPYIDETLDRLRSLLSGDYQYYNGGIKVLDKSTGHILHADSDELYEKVQTAAGAWRFHTYNPYEEMHLDRPQDIELFTNLHNSKRNIAFGMFGKNNDKDKFEKLNELYELKKNLRRPVAMEITTDNDHYYGVVYTKIKDFNR